jgi:hypothetical protein
MHKKKPPVKEALKRDVIQVRVWEIIKTND